MLSARILSLLSRDPTAPDYAGGTIRTRLDDALNFLNYTVPGFIDLIRDKFVLDFGCGWGWQAIAMARGGGEIGRRNRYSRPQRSAKQSRRTEMLRQGTVR